VYNLQLRDCLAGDAVLIAPVSKQIPWYQGILQGILRFWGLETRFSSKKSLRYSHFSSNSLSKLTGKIFRGTGKFWPVTGNFHLQSSPGESFRNFGTSTEHQKLGQRKLKRSQPRIDRCRSK